MYGPLCPTLNPASRHLQASTWWKPPCLQIEPCTLSPLARRPAPKPNLSSKAKPVSKDPERSLLEGISLSSLQIPLR